MMIGFSTEHFLLLLQIHLLQSEYAFKAQQYTQSQIHRPIPTQVTLVNNRHCLFLCLFMVRLSMSLALLMVHKMFVTLFTFVR